jgi:hypothetical protein
MRNYSGPLSWPVGIIVLVVIAALALATWGLIGLAYGADNSPPCLTKAQAQAKWPGQWLYWHTANRCWDNVNTRSTSSHAVAAAIKRVPYSVNRNPLQLNKPLLDANGNTIHHSGRPIVLEPGPTVAYPTLMAGGGTSDDMLNPTAMNTWPLIADFDEDPPQFIPWQRRVISSLTAADGRP